MNISKKSLFTNPTYNKISSIPISSQIYFWLGYFAFNTIRWGSFYKDYAYSLNSHHSILSFYFCYASKAF